MAEQLRQSVELGNSSSTTQSMHEGQSQKVGHCLPPSALLHYSASLSLLKP